MKTASSASDTMNLSISSLYRPTDERTVSFKSRSSSVSSDGAGITPSKYLTVMDSVRFTRLPKILARSELYLLMTFSYVIVPSLPYGISANE